MVCFSLVKTVSNVFLAKIKNQFFAKLEFIRAYQKWLIFPLNLNFSDFNQIVFFRKRLLTSFFKELE